MPRSAALTPEAVLEDASLPDITAVLRAHGVTVVLPEVMRRVLGEADRWQNPNRLAASYLFELYLGMLRPK